MKSWTRVAGEHEGSKAPVNDVGFGFLEDSETPATIRRLAELLLSKPPSKVAASKQYRQLRARHIRIGER